MIVPSLSPLSVFEGSGQFNLTVSGGTFTASSVVRWNNSPLQTTFENASTVKAVVPASNVSQIGVFSITVTTPGAGTFGPELFSVQDAPLTITQVTPPNVVEGQPTGTMQVATFTDANPNGQASEFTATITWGDGESSTGTIAKVGNTFTVTASKPNAYSRDGGYSMTVEVAGKQNSSAWSSIADMPDNRYDIAAATGADGRTYVIGGATYTITTTNTVFAYSPSTNSWSTVQNLNNNRTAPAAAAGPDGRIYAMGGGGTGTNGVARSVEVYNPSNNTWTAVADMPGNRRALAAATGTDGRIYAMGGAIFNNPSQASNVSNSLFAYNPSNNTWSTLASMVNARYYLGAAAWYDGRIFAIGGYIYTTGSTAIVEAYSPSSNTWQNVAPMPSARFGFGVAVRPEGIYVIGGYDPSKGGNTDTVYLYNPNTNTWSNAPSLTKKRAYSAASVGSDSRIFEFGGFNTSPTLPEKSAEAFGNSLTPSKTSSTATAVVRNAAFTVTLNPLNVVEGTATGSLVLGTLHDDNPNSTVTDFAVSIKWGDGITTPGMLVSLGNGNFNIKSAQPHSYVEEGYYTWEVTVTNNNGSPAGASTGSWAQSTPMPMGKYEHSVVAGPDGRIYAIGGGPSNSFNRVLVYTPSTGSWDSVANLPTSSVDQPAAVSADGRIYAAANTGSSNSNLFSYNPGTNTWTLVTNNLSLRTGAAALGSDRRLYFLGGPDPYFQYSTQVIAITPSGGFQGVPAMPHRRGYFGAVTGLDGILYVFSGDAPGGATNAVDAYNPATNTWSSKANIPSARFGFGTAMAPDGRIYIIGGYAPSLGGYTNTVLIYDPATDTWTNGPSLNAAVGYLGAATGGDGNIYAIGGINDQVGVERLLTAPGTTTSSFTNTTAIGTPVLAPAAATGPDGLLYSMGGSANGNAAGAINTVEVFSTAKRLWSTAAPMPTARYYLGAASGPNNRLYAIGGLNASGPLGTVEAYNPGTNTWATAPSLLTARFALGVTSGLDGKIYALGGETNSATSAAAEVFDTGTNAWTALTSMPTARRYLAAVTGLDGRIYAIGGYANGIGGLATVEAFDPVNKTWTTLASMPHARYGHNAAAGKDGRIYVAGGYVPGAAGYDDAVYSYNPTTNTWQLETRLRTSRAYSGATRGIDGNFYLLGGVDSQDKPLQKVEYMTIDRIPSVVVSSKSEVVADAPLTLTFVASPSFTPGAPTGTIVAAKFTDADPNGVAADYLATIDWGDGQSSAGTIVADPNGGFQVQGSKPSPYANPGSYTLKVTIADTDGQPANPNSWTGVADMPAVRFSMGTTRGLDGKIYAVNGYGPSGATNTLMVYSPVSNAWSFAASSNFGRYDLAAATAPDGSIFAVGGSTTKVEFYIPSVNQWRNAADMPVPLTAPGAATGPDGKIYVAGGVNTQTGNPSGALYAYNPATDTWATLAGMNSSRGYLGVVAGLDGRIYAIGGGTPGFSASSIVEAYSPANNTWTTLAPLPAPLRAPAVTVAADGRIYVIGGAGATAGTYSSAVYVYTPATNSWAAGPSLTAARGYMGSATALNGDIFTFGGYSSAGGGRLTAEVLGLSRSQVMGTGTVTV